MRESTAYFECILLAYILTEFAQKGTGQPDSQHAMPEHTTGQGPQQFNLEAWQKQFKQAYPESIEFFIFKNSSRDLRENYGGSRAESKCSELTSFPDINDFVKEIVAHPRARLYSGENYTGEYEDYDSAKAQRRGGCYYLKKLKYRVKSIQNGGKCVRLFHSYKCDGWSLAVYPGSEHSHRVLNDELNQILSVGPCLPYEFQSSSFRVGSNKYIQKSTLDFKSYIPDLVEFYSGSKYNNPNTKFVSSGSIVAYLLGPQNRVEFLVAVVHSANFGLSPPTSNIEESSFYKSLEKEENDVLCYGIPLKLGGPANKSYNVFPARPSSIQKWMDVVSRIPPPSTLTIPISLNLMYENDRRTRPYAFYYWVGIGNTEVFYGRIIN